MARTYVPAQTSSIEIPIWIDRYCVDVSWAKSPTLSFPVGSHKVSCPGIRWGGWPSA